MYRNFAILASIKPSDATGGYLFAVLNAFDTVVDLGILLQPAGLLDLSLGWKIYGVYGEI